LPRSLYCNWTIVWVYSSQK